MNYYEFLKFIQKSAQRKDKGKHFCFGNPGVSRNQLQSRCTIHMSLSFASGTLDCFLFEHEVLSSPCYEQRTEEDRRPCAFWPMMATPAVREGWGSTRRLPRIHKTTQLGARRLVVAWPRSPLRHGGRPWWPCSGVAIGRGRERAGGGDGWGRRWGASPLRQPGVGAPGRVAEEEGRARAWMPRPGRVLSVEAFYRARVGQWSGSGGTRFWTPYGPI